MQMLNFSPDLPRQIRAVTEARPEESFRAGANDLEIFVLERIPRGVALLRIEIEPPPPSGGAALSP